MNFNIILMAVFLVFTVGCAIRALLSPVAKNIRRLVAVPLSFLICYLLQSHGLFDALGNAVEGMLMDNEMLAALLEASPYLDKLIVGTVSGIASSLLFPIVFVLVYLVIRGLLKAFFDRLLLRLLDRQTKNKVIISLRRVGSLLLGGVGGLLISAVLLMPVFYLSSFASAAVHCARIPCEEEIVIREELEIIDETFVTPYEQSTAVQIYRTLGLHDLMCHTAELGSHAEIDGKTLYACQTIRNVLTHVPNIYIHMEAWSVSDAPMAEDFAALAEDEFIIGILADILQHEAQAAVKNEPGLFLHPETEEESTSAYILRIFADAYGHATHAEIENDLHTILAAGDPLSKNNFFNDFTRSFVTGKDGDAAMTQVLLKNLRLAGQIMDALFVSDPSHRFSDTIFDILLEDENVQKFISHETIDELNLAVENGETTYESFTVFLQGIMGIITTPITA